jgi:hypothetical protein
MSDHYIVEKINRLGELFADMISNPEVFNISSNKAEETNELIKEIVDYLVWFPGALFYDSDHTRLKRNEAVIKMLWLVVDSDEIFDELLSGGYSGLLANMLGDFSNRVRMLKPTFISIKPETTEFSQYFQEAMKAWLFGLSNSALIICFAVIEDLLKDRLCQVNIDYVYELKDPSNPKGVKQVSYNRIIMKAMDEGLITKQEKNNLLKIKKLRNNSIHSLTPISDSDVYEAIIHTKCIVEKLLRKT